MDDVQLTSYRPEDAPELRALIASVGWSEPQIDGQLEALARLARDAAGHVAIARRDAEIARRDAEIARRDTEIARRDAEIARRDAEIAGYACAQFHAWNRLGQIQGLVVRPASRRQGIATRLVRAMEEWARARGARGLYVDTPVDNAAGRRFYEAIGFRLAYVMPEYYDVGQDGVTYVKFYRPGGD